MVWYDARAAMPSPEQAVALEVAREAGRMLRDELGRARRVRFKGTPTNLVTEMDGRAEALIVERLRRYFPEDAVLAEEQGAAPGTSGRRWIIDPLDGTTNYAHGVPVYAVSIALEVRGRLTFGVVYDPNQEELFWAERGGGAFLNGARLAVSTTATLNESLLATGFPYNVREVARNNLVEYGAFSLRSQGVRRMGSAVIYLAYVAAGRLDGYWELRLGPWDVAAGGLMVEEAGGRVTDLTGGVLNVDAPEIVASNGRIHDEMLRTLEEVRATSTI
jgi:myo-inositol-1(or 4)-monophosphatase